MLLDDAAADGEAKARAAFLPRIGGLDLLESVEDAVELIAGNTAAFIRDFEEDGISCGFSVDADRGSRGGKLDGVGEKIGQDLKDAVGVAIEEQPFQSSGLSGGQEFEMDRIGLGHGSHGFDSLTAEIAKRAAAYLQGSSSGLHALDVQNVVDKADETVRVGDSNPEQIERLGIDIADGAGREQAERASDAGERRSEFVRNGRDEFVFESVEVGTLGKLNIVLVLLFACQSELGREFSRVTSGS